MIELASVDTPALAFVAGLVTSLHCAGMCGPLACLIAPGPKDRADPTTVFGIYHVSRIIGYTLLGLVAGGIGRMPVSFLSSDVIRYLPWVLVLFFVVVAFRLDQRLPKSRWIGALTFKWQASLRGKPRELVAAGMGLMTPLLPCGPLYFLIALSAISGSAARGAEFMLAFGAGTVPLLWLAQNRIGWLRGKLSPRALARWQAGLAMVAALVISWRLRATLGIEGPEPGIFLCH